MPIEEHPYHLYEQSLEIFPERFSNDSFVVYHGTSILNSERIETNGFQIGIAPFEINSGIELVELLRMPEFSVYDTPKGIFRKTTADGLEHYIQYIQSGKARLSFSSLSFAAASFASGQLKGGQALHYIHEARLILHQAVFNKPSLRTLITESICRDLDYQQVVQNNFGVVYAVKIPENLEGFELQNNVVYSSNAILPESIVAKVIIREINDIGNTLLNDKIKSKLLKTTPPIGLQIHFGRKISDNQIEMSDF